MWREYNGLLSPIVGLAGCTMVCLIAKIYKGNGLDWLGRKSLVLMCAHLFALETLGKYIIKIADALSLTGEAKTICVTLIHVVFPIAVALVIDIIKTSLNSRRENVESHVMSARDGSIDVAKGILITLMLIGRYSINSTLRSTIFSCHMVGFVVLSGYFYKSDRPISITLKRMSNSFLKPYAIAAIIAIVLQFHNWNSSFIRTKVLQYMAGMSFSKRLFTEFDSVDPFYFILLLFTVRLLYMSIDHIVSKESLKWTIVILVSLVGVLWGAKGYWLPWSFDVACYALVFYKIGKRQI